MQHELEQAAGTVEWGNFSSGPRVSQQLARMLRSELVTIKRLSFLLPSTYNIEFPAVLSYILVLILFKGEHCVLWSTPLKLIGALHNGLWATAAGA